jgi:integrase
MRVHKPWFRKSRDAWFVEINGKQVKLADGKGSEREAYREFYRLMSVHEGKIPEPGKLTVAHVCDLFLIHAQKHTQPRTFRWYKAYLQSFCERFPTLPALETKPFHVTQWLDEHPAWKNSRRCAIVCVKRAFNWCECEGLLPSNPLRKLRKPPSVSRDRILSVEERQQIMAAIKDQEFRDFVFAMQETGCRPGEIRKVTAAQVNLEHGIWVIEHHKTRKKTGQARIVYLTPPMIDLCRTLMAKWPTGPIFRGPKRKGSKPFSRNAIRCRFMRLRKKLPHLQGVISYTYRHTYTTDALERGVPMATVAELIGHKDLKMIAAHYSHLSEKRKHLSDAARKATGYEPGPGGPEPKRDSA